MKKKSRRAGIAEKHRPWRTVLLTSMVIVILAVLYLLFGGSIRGTLRRRQLHGLNVILITLDTLRADHLSCYDKRFAATPNLDRLAAAGALFEHCVAQTPLTLPSHTTILSGTYPYFHQVRANKTTKVPSGLPLISEAFQNRGFATSAFIGAVVLHSTFGLNRGFDIYADRFDSHNAFFNWDEIRKPANVVLNEARLWLERNSGQRFFSWIHLYDPHAPWDPPSPFREQYPGHPYRATVAFMDAELGKFFTFLKQSGLWPKTLIVIVGDHGESLGEHGEETHGFFIYEATVRVPFLVRLPFALPQKRLGQRVELADVAPTILQVLGFEIPRTVQGHSLLDLILGKPSNRPDTAYTETYYPRIHFGWSELTAFYQGGMKYIRAPREELYDLEQDPGEIRNLAGIRNAEAKRLRSLINRLMASAPSDAFTPEILHLNAEMQNKLASLGYITSTVNQTAEEKLTDPKDKIGIINQLLSVKELAEKGNWPETGKTARLILKDNPQVGQARIASANSYRAAGDFPQAIKELREGLTYQDNDNQILALLGDTLSMMGRYREAVAVFESCVTINPENPANYNNLGLAYWNNGEVAKAEAAYQKALQQDSQFALTHANLGLLYLIALRDYRRAKESLLTAVALDPNLASAHDALGGYYAKTGEFAKAREHWLRCLEIEPTNYDACFSLFMLYSKKMPNRQEALAYYDRIRRDFFPKLPEAERRTIEEIRKSLN
jgi:arylsulfatase A-like enzyme/tetratricopeptide (TPR) repeat protein